MLLQIVVISLSWAVAQAPAPNPGFPTCNVCGLSGYIVTNNNATISFPGYPPFTCDVIQRGALAGFVNPMYCPVFPLFNIPKICGCTGSPTSHPTIRPVAPTSVPSTHKLETFAPTVSPMVEPTGSLIKPFVGPVTLSAAPKTTLTTRSPTASPTSNLIPFLPSETPVLPTTVPVVPTSSQVTPLTAAPIVPTLAPLQPASAGAATAKTHPASPNLEQHAPATAPLAPLAAPALLTAVPILPSAARAPVTPSLSPIHPTTRPLAPAATSVSPVDTPRPPVAPTAITDLSNRPYVARKRRPTRPFHIGMAPFATSSEKPTLAHHSHYLLHSKPDSNHVTTPPSTPLSNPLQNPSRGAASSPHRRRHSNARNNPLTATPTIGRDTKTHRHRHKSTSARDSVLTLSPTVGPKGASQNTARLNIFDRAQPHTKQGSKQFKKQPSKKIRG